MEENKNLLSEESNSYVENSSESVQQNNMDPQNTTPPSFKSIGEESNQALGNCEILKKNRFLDFIKSKKGMIICAVSVVVFSTVFFFVNQHIKEKHYEENLREFMIESGKAAIGAGYVCDEISTIWHNYIWKDKKYFNNTTGQLCFSYEGSDVEYCTDFSEAVHCKIEWNHKHLSATLNDPYYKAKALYKEMTPPPSKYKDLHIYVKQMFKALDRLRELSEHPTGNYATYSANCTEATDDYTSALRDLTNECDIDFSKYEKHNEDDARDYDEREFE